MFINAFMRLSCMLHTKTYCLTFETDILCSIGVFKTLFYGLLSFLRPYENLWTLLLVHDQNNGHPPHTLLVHDHDLLIVRGFSSPKLLRLRPSGRRPHRFHHHGSNATLLPNSTSLNQTHWRWNVPACYKRRKNARGACTIGATHQLFSPPVLRWPKTFGFKAAWHDIACCFFQG